MRVGSTHLNNTHMWSMCEWKFPNMSTYIWVVYCKPRILKRDIKNKFVQMKLNNTLKLSSSKVKSTSFGRPKWPTNELKNLYFKRNKIFISDPKSQGNGLHARFGFTDHLALIANFSLPILSGEGYQAKWIQHINIAWLGRQWIYSTHESWIIEICQ